ncbi:DUF4249 domain-containing protein [Flavobacteriales bacterium]|nr:DUF4249 domain-containing protein [Flavobacteriales bacterium]
MKTFNYSILLIVLLGLTSCTQNTIFKVKDSTPVMVVDAEITTQAKVHRVKLTESTNVFFDEKAPAVEGATVVIEDSRYKHMLTEVAPGIYETLDTVRGYVGEEYRLSIEKDGEFYSARETLRPVGDIECAFLVKGDSTSLFLADEYLILMSGSEPEGLGDFYLWNYYEDGVLISDTVTEKFYGDDEFIDGTDFTAVLVAFVDTEKVDPVNKTVMLEMKSISEGYYDYLFGLQLETFRGSPFDGPPANPPTNMSEGAIGFFRATDISQKDMCVLLDVNTALGTCDQGCLDDALLLLENQ